MLACLMEIFKDRMRRIQGYPGPEGLTRFLTLAMLGRVLSEDLPLFICVNVDGRSLSHKLMLQYDHRDSSKTQCTGFLLSLHSPAAQDVRCQRPLESIPRAVTQTFAFPLPTRNAAQVDQARIHPHIPSQ